MRHTERNNAHYDTTCALALGFIDHEVVRLNAGLHPPSRSNAHVSLDRLFVETLREVNGEGIGPCVQVDDS